MFIFTCFFFLWLFVIFRGENMEQNRKIIFEKRKKNNIGKIMKDSSETNKKKSDVTTLLI